MNSDRQRVILSWDNITRLWCTYQLDDTSTASSTRLEMEEPRESDPYAKRVQCRLLFDISLLKKFVIKDKGRIFFNKNLFFFLRSFWVIHMHLINMYKT